MEDACPYCGSVAFLEKCESCGDYYCEDCLCPPERDDGRRICPNCDGRAGKGE